MLILVRRWTSIFQFSVLPKHPRSSVKTIRVISGFRTSVACRSGDSRVLFRAIRHPQIAPGAVCDPSVTKKAGESNVLEASFSDRTRTCLMRWPSISLPSSIETNVSTASGRGGKSHRLYRDIVRYLSPNYPAHAATCLIYSTLRRGQASPAWALGPCTPPELPVVRLGTREPLSPTIYYWSHMWTCCILPGSEGANNPTRV